MSVSGLRSIDNGMSVELWKAEKKRLALMSLKNPSLSNGINLREYIIGKEAVCMGMDAELEINQLKANLLKTQRYLARFMIHTNGQITYDLLRSSAKPTKQIISQLIADESAAFVALKSSDDPLSIANEFQNKCNEPLVKLGLAEVKF